MSETDKTKNQPVKVEDLLRLKRHEQPDQAYWERFDRELHEKTLRTLVQTRPTTRSIWAALGRWQAALPLAGAAAFALTLFVGNGLVTLPVATAPLEVAAQPIQVQAESTPNNVFTGQPTGSPSYVVSALPARESYSEGKYTQVPASRAMTPAHRPEVQFVGGTIATSIPNSGFTAGIY